MGRRGSRIIAAAIIAGLAVGPAWAKTNYHSGIWNLLREGGFFFAETGESSARMIGSVKAGGKHYEIWRYAYVRASGAGRAHYELLIFEKASRGLSYFGSYSVDGVPVRIHEQTIKFDYGKNEDVGEGRPPAKRGDEVVFDDNGPPPVILLDGEFRWLEPSAHHVGTWRTMDVGHFTGPADIYARIWPAGSIEAGARRFQIWGYAWKQEPKLKDEPYKQERYKVLVFEEKGGTLSYLGGYERNDVPFHVEGQTVKFDPVSQGTPAIGAGDAIVFNEKGPPPEARISGQVRPFVK